jgi:hypothetical protein
MENNQINDAAKAIALLSTLISQSNNKLRADDVAEIVNSYVESALAVNGDIAECIMNAATDFEMHDGQVLKVKTDEQSIITAINAFVIDMYDEDYGVDCTFFVKANAPDFDAGLTDFFNFETDFHVRVCFSRDKKHVLVTYMLEY